MAVREFTLENLAHLDDGRVVLAFNQAVRRAVRDCEDRPGTGDTRKVLLQCELSPICDEHGDLQDIVFGFQVKDSVPTRKSKKYTGAYRETPNGTNLVFNDLSEGNPAQRTLDEDNPQAWSGDNAE